MALSTALALGVLAPGNLQHVRVIVVRDGGRDQLSGRLELFQNNTLLWILILPMAQP